MKIKKKFVLLSALIILSVTLTFMLFFDGLRLDDGTNISDEYNISVVLSTSDFSNIYHDSVSLISKERMKIAYDNGTEIVPKNEKYLIDSSKMNVGDSIHVITENSGAVIIDSIKRSYGSGEYSGTIDIYRVEEGFVIVNTLSLETYLRYVVPSEMPSDYGTEALKAQAICARNFAVQHILNPAYPQFNASLDDSIRYQVYNNQVTSKNADMAIAETENQVMTYKGEVISAYYYSTSWGHGTDLSLWNGAQCAYYKSLELSENHEYIDLKNEESFKDYLVNSRDAYESGEPWYRWTYFISLDDIISNMVNYLSMKVNSIDNIEIISRRAGGGVSQLEVSTDDNTYILNKESEIRNIFIPINCELKRSDGSVLNGYEKCPSSYYLIEPSYEDDELTGYVLSGGGCGHGLGMSQNCAKILAQNGKSYKEILSYFYPETSVEEFGL